MDDLVVNCIKCFELPLVVEIICMEFIYLFNWNSIAILQILVFSLVVEIMAISFFFNLSTEIILIEWQEEDCGAGYVVQPVVQTEEGGAGGIVMEPGNEEDDDAEEKEEVEDDDNDNDVRVLPPSSSSQLKRKRNGIADKDDNGEDDEEEDDVVDCSKSTKKHR